VLATILVFGADLRLEAAEPQELVLSSVRVTTVTLRQGGRLRVSFQVRNTSANIARTQSPRPGTLYSQTENWRVRGFTARPGRFRLGLTIAGPRGERYPFRWGLGRDLRPREIRRVVGYIRMTRPGYYNFFPAIIKEGDGIREGRSVGLVHVVSRRPLRGQQRYRTVGARILVNGREAPFDVPPKIVYATILVPLRFVGEALGAQVSWDRRTRVATMRGNGRVVTARIGDPIVRSDGKRFTAYTYPRIIQGRTMVPLRIVGYALGASVGWDERTKTVSITTAGQRS
jgi:hypothetical protein